MATTVVPGSACAAATCSVKAVTKSALRAMRLSNLLCSLISEPAQRSG